MAQDGDADAKALGEILVTMMTAGATTEVLGRFALLYRNRYSSAGEPAQLLEMGPILEAFAKNVAQQVLAGHAAAQPGAGAITSAAALSSSPTLPARASTGTKVLSLKCAGKKTSVSIPLSLHDRCVARIGTDGFRRLLAELGNVAPATGRSGYVQNALTDFLARAEAGAAATPKSRVQ